MTINLNIDGKIFNDAYRNLLNDNTRTQIFMGGSSAGKSIFCIGQRMILDLLKGKRNYLGIRNTANTIRGSIYNEAIKGIARLRMQDYFKINKTEMTITCQNGYQAILKGLDDVEKIKSITSEKGVITDILIEESTETKRDDIKQLLRRLRGKSSVPKRMTLILNPINKNHWIYEDYFKNRFMDDDTFYKDEKLFILKTTYKDNLRFLEQDDVDELENETNKYYYDVYTLGNWGVLGKLVFNNWKVEDLMAMRDNFHVYENGLDFGFTNDPTALVRSSTHKKVIYILDELYEYGLTNDIIADRLRSIIGDEIVYCDSAEPKSIAELSMHGIKAASAMKGPGSLNYGIQYLNQFEIVIDRKCQNTANEFSLYQYQQNKDGNYINAPVDKNNHAIDALRYSKSYEIFAQRQVKTYDTPREAGVYIP